VRKWQRRLQVWMRIIESYEVLFGREEQGAEMESAVPAVHLGHLAGDLDQAVQAMHVHIRRSVVPIRKAGRSNLVEYLVPGDQGYYTGEDFNEANILKSIDVAAAVGSELFILDAWWWDVFGERTPSARRFPHGLGPLHRPSGRR
jgi:hypothetical protein